MVCLVALDPIGTSAGSIRYNQKKSSIYSYIDSID